MKTFSVVLLVFLSSAGFSKEKYKLPTVPLSKEHQYLQKNHAPDFWSMMGFYRAQETGSACSVTSVMMVMNAILQQKDSSSDLEFTRHGLSRKKKENRNFFEVAKIKKWEKSVDHGGSGTTLEELYTYTLQAFQAFQIDSELRKIGAVEKKDAISKSDLIKILKENEKDSKDYLIANFDQAILTGEADSGASYGHIAPIGAYDEKNDRVLIFDPDRDWYEPYWVSADQFLKSIHSIDPVSKKTRGLLWIKWKSGSTS